jgi:hypothetical protein
MIANSCHYLGADLALLDDNVTLYRRCCLIFAHLLDPVEAGAVFADHLNHHHRIFNDGRATLDWRAGHETTGIPSLPLHDNLEIGPTRAARLAVQPSVQCPEDVVGDGVMFLSPTRHGPGGDAIELIAQFLALFPRQEVHQGHRIG